MCTYWALESLSAPAQATAYLPDALAHTGLRLPNLSQLKLNNSNIPTVRDLGTSFTKLTVLWLSRCNVVEVDGISAFPSLKELYVAFNEVKDLSAVCSCDSLEVLDLEGNSVEDISEVYFLGSCLALSALTLEGNPVQGVKGYRRLILEALPDLKTLDDYDRDAPFDEDEDTLGGGDAFAVNVSLDAELQGLSLGDLSNAEHENDDAVDVRRASGTPVKGGGKEDMELMIVHQVRVFVSLRAHGRVFLPHSPSCVCK